MRYAKEIKALAKKVAAGEFAYVKSLYKEDRLDLIEDGVTEREYMEGATDNVDSVLADEVIGNLTDEAIKEYNKLVREHFRKK